MLQEFQVEWTKQVLRSYEILYSKVQELTDDNVNFQKGQSNYCGII